MEATNLFEHVDFGDMFLTRDGRRAVYVRWYTNSEGKAYEHVLYVEHNGINGGEFDYRNSGRYNMYREDDIDIVGRYTEES